MNEPAKKEADNQLGCFVLGVLGLGALIWIGSASKDETSNASMAINSPETETLTDSNTVEPATPAPLDTALAGRGYSQFRKIAALKVDGSAQIYSRNCYDAVEKSFDWHQLDRCGAFDALAVRWVDQGETTDNDAFSYFESETAATRYLKLASEKGLAPEEADKRWARLQGLAQKAKLPISAPILPAPSITDDETDGGDLNVAVDENGVAI